jgi:serine protease Do
MAFCPSVWNQRFWFAAVAAFVLAGSFSATGYAQDQATKGLADVQDVEVEAERARLFSSLAAEVEQLEKHSNVLKKVVKLVSPTVVHIEADKIDQLSLRFGRQGQIEEAGSGCIIALAGRYFVLTNRHVIKNAVMRDIKIKLADGRMLTPERVWSDPATDVAVMAISGQHLVPARIGNSDQTEIGDFVLAVGSPFGLSHSVTFGIVSAKGRRDLELGDDVKFQDFMQTDAAINPGNSGGPLMNLRGEVIGINTAIASSSGGSEGIGFTIPINMAMVIARQLVERGTVVRAFLGVRLDAKFGPAMATTVGLQRPRGTRITEITPGSPAESAKLQVNDIILEYDGVRIDNDSHLINLVSLTPVGKDVPVVVLRQRSLLTVRVKVGTATPATSAVNR